MSYADYIYEQTMQTLGLSEPDMAADPDNQAESAEQAWA